MGKSTPGPWHLEYTTPAEQIEIWHIDEQIALVDGYSDAAENHANARLIAAAPAMLEALHHAVLFIKTMAGDTPEWGPHFLKIVQDAIAETTEAAEVKDE